MEGLHVCWEKDGFLLRPAKKEDMDGTEYADLILMAILEDDRRTIKKTEGGEVQ